VCGPRIRELKPLATSATQADREVLTAEVDGNGDSIRFAHSEQGTAFALTIPVADQQPRC
jgi:hypothetical protein